MSHSRLFVTTYNANPKANEKPTQANEDQRRPTQANEDPCKPTTDPHTHQQQQQQGGLKTCRVLSPRYVLFFHAFFYSNYCLVY